MLKSIECSQCKISFITSNKTTVFCSKSCPTKFRRIRDSVLVKLVCKNCGKQYRKRPCEVTVCCSRQCANFFKVPKETRVCKECKKKFILTHFADRSGKFCSRRC